MEGGSGTVPVGDASLVSVSAAELRSTRAPAAPSSGSTNGVTTARRLPMSQTASFSFQRGHTSAATSGGGQLPTIAQHIATTISQTASCTSRFHSSTLRRVTGVSGDSSLQHINAANSVSRAATSTASSSGPRFNGVSVFHRVSRPALRTGANRAHSDHASASSAASSVHSEASQGEHYATAHSLLSNWLTLARTKITKKESAKKKLNMSWYRCSVQLEDDCCICLDEIPAGAKVTRLPCNHVFHHACIVEWVEKKKNCPQCRAHAKSDRGPLPPPRPRQN